jgi:predicted phage-related endonuclease
VEGEGVMLTAEQQAARKGKLTASRVACLMTGDAVKIMQLYREMIGAEEPENLDHVWPVRLGEATEALQLDWYEMKNGGAVSRRGEVVVHPTLTWAAATLDGWDDVLRSPIEVKHVGGREPLEIIIERYWPQMGWQMFVTGADRCALSVIMGSSEPIVEFIDRDEEYIAEMVSRGQQFMGFVAKRNPPVVLPAVAAPIVADKSYDLSQNNTWSNYAAEWIETRSAAERCKGAEKILKEAVPADAKKAFGCGVRISRDRAGRLSLREDKNEAA